MKTIIKLAGLTLLIATLFLGSTTQSQAHPDGYWDHYGHWHSYGYYHHHHGYWDDRGDGHRVWVNIDL